jgi:hypothetical protein
VGAVASHNYVKKSDRDFYARYCQPSNPNAGVGSEGGQAAAAAGVDQQQRAERCSLIAKRLLLHQTQGGGGEKSTFCARF